MNNENTINRPDSFESTISDKHGCIWFNENELGIRDANNCGGWACIGGGEPFSFKKYNELPLDVIWWTNLNKAESWRFGKVKRFKENTVFGIEWMALINEAGLAKDTKAMIVKYWSEVFGRSAEWLSRWAKSIDEETPWDWGEGELLDVLKDKMIIVEPSETLEVNHVLSKAYYEVVECEVSSEILEGKRNITLSIPRLKHAENILSSKYPAGNWNLIKQNDWPYSFNDKIKWIKDHNLPMLIEIDNLEFTENNQYDFSIGEMWLGKRGYKLNSTFLEPIWLTEKEIMELSGIASFEIISAYICNEWQYLNYPKELLNNNEGPLIHWSMTKGLLANATWQALSSPGRDPRTRRKGSYNARSVWFRAVDREISFKAAIKMKLAGYTVLSYGNGQIKIAFDPKGDATRLAVAAKDAGLIIPTILSDKLPDINENINSNTANSMKGIAEIDQWIKYKWSLKKKEIENLKPLYIDIDRLVLPWPGSSNNSERLKNTAMRLISFENRNNKTQSDDWWVKTLKEQASISVQTIKKLQNKS